MSSGPVKARCKMLGLWHPKHDRGTVWPPLASIPAHTHARTCAHIHTQIHTLMDIGKDLAKTKAIQTGTKVWTQKERFTTWSYKMFGDKIYSFSVKVSVIILNCLMIHL